MRRLLAVLTTALLLAACASMEANKNAETKVFAVQADYNALLKIAVAYERQPRCAVAETKLNCSDVSVVREIRRADEVAWAAIKAAQDTVRAPGVSASTMSVALTGAINAVGVLRTVLVTYRIGGL